MRETDRLVVSLCNRPRADWCYVDLSVTENYFTIFLENPILREILPN